MVKRTQFFFNGETYTVNQRITLIDLLNYFNYTNSLFVLEYNNLICEKKKWKNITINSFDKIEIVTIVGGG